MKREKLKKSETINEKNDGILVTFIYYVNGFTDTVHNFWFPSLEDLPPLLEDITQKTTGFEPSFDLDVEIWLQTTGGEPSELIRILSYRDGEFHIRDIVNKLSDLESDNILKFPTIT